MGSFRFEKLEVWHRSIELADLVYKLTAAFPADERFGLVSQMRRAAVSISSNIAEGSGRASDRDFARFVEIAYGSLMEVVSQSHIARKQGFLDGASFDSVTEQASEVARMLSGLKASLERG
jgi:four helix bundle protein